MNGTTTWERWDSMLPNGSLNTVEMTSFNHYAVGSVGSWIHENIGGLSPAEPGWRRSNIDVKPGGGDTSDETRFLSPYGLVGARWVVEEGKECEESKLDVTVPPNSEVRRRGERKGRRFLLGRGFTNSQGVWISS
ncbi:bacterial alpha-L-rhamnosidase-domain-containing protein [Aspergillus ambiguus]|uniref:bacterial alpha-L-rhamnosidase-domain-containing protein n=1 Tax=Aspergillus ambiguus TaxID=176160 RepID=UPI003CCCE37B